jgi:hypothetical protein
MYMYIHGNTLYYVSSSWMLCALFSEYVMIQWSIIARYKIQVATIDPDYVTSNVWELILWWEYECALSEAGHQMVSALSQSVWASHFPDAAFRVLLLAVLLGANDVCSVMLAPTVFFRHPCPEIFMIGMVAVLHSRSSNHGALIFPS